MAHESERSILIQIRTALGIRPDVILWRNNTGVLPSPTGATRFGLGVGSADLVGMLSPSGRFFALEVKTPSGKVSEDQRRWHDVVRRHGGFCAVVRSVAEAEAALERAKRGERS